MRAFLAIDTGPQPRSDEREGGDRADSHLTLRFFGEIGPEIVRRVIEAVPTATREVAPFDLALGGVGAFPSADRPRVVWLGVTHGDAEVRRLERRLDDALTSIGLPPPDGRFVPHVTLFRVRSPQDRARASALLAGEVPAPILPAVRVAAVALKQSTLSARGARHSVVRAFPLEAPWLRSD
jgi:RNA 2',3'-cyclic 3'-phosphodiesterase